MSRRGGFLNAAIKAAAAAQRAQLHAQRAHDRARARTVRERARQDRLHARQGQIAFLQGREQEAKALNNDLIAQIEDLEGLLTEAVETPPFSFDWLKKKAEVKPFVAGALSTPEPAPMLDRYMPAPLVGAHRFLPWSKRTHAQAGELALARYGEEVAVHREREGTREKTLAKAKEDHQLRTLAAEKEANDWNSQVDQFAADYQQGLPQAILDFARTLLESSDYPAGFPKAVLVAYVNESKQLVVDYELPTIDVVPDVSAYKFVKAKNEIATTSRSVTQRKALYLSVVAQVTLRSLHELFAADTANYIESVVLNGHVTAVDRGTGKAIRPCLVTVRTDRQAFADLNLAQVEPSACLTRLNASVSPSPTELVAVKPVLEFNMVDRRFVQEADVLSTLDQRPNLMALSPTEFEFLITNLFQKMGLETRQTQASRDGGVDCVAFDTRPIFGGKVIIQAKRYKNTVGVSAVRDLFGTLQNEGASKGILVTTSGYGKAAFEFADGKPIELLSGTHLLYLLEQHAGIKAKIEPPDDWRDPIIDSPEPSAHQ